MSASRATGGANQLGDLPRLGDEALGPCAMCHALVLESALPLFYRVTVEYCGVDARAVQERAGLAMMLGGGAAGLTLSGVLGGHKHPVVVTGSGTTNLCMRCAQQNTDLMVLCGTALEGGSGA